MRKSFKDLTEEEMKTLIWSTIDGAIAGANKVNMGGLSISGSHNLYKALKEAIRAEYDPPEVEPDYAKSDKIVMFCLHRAFLLDIGLINAEELNAAADYLLRPEEIRSEAAEERFIKIYRTVMKRFKEKKKGDHIFYTFG